MDCAVQREQSHKGLAVSHKDKNHRAGVGGLQSWGHHQPSDPSVELMIRKIYSGVTEERLFPALVLQQHTSC